MSAASVRTSDQCQCFKRLKMVVDTGDEKQCLATVLFER